MPRFTVILPTHNRADVLPFAIRSVLAQTVADFELLVAGDGCTDSTAAVVQSFGDDRIRWLELPKAPHFGYANRNVALRQARGELIAYMAHDDLWLPDHLEILGRALDEDGVDLAYSLLLLVSTRGVVTPKIQNLNERALLQKMCRGLRRGLGISCVAHRRDALERFGYWDEAIPRAGDTELWCRIINGGGRFTYVPVPTALHFVAAWRKATWRYRLFVAVCLLEGSLPPELRFSIPDGMSEQETLWRHLSGDLRTRTRDLRRAVQLHLDRRVSAPYLSNVLALLNDLLR
ncbi:MAG TPA: glycosyltransferase family A protein [Thermoanaerobaculia bacterium]|nr:glycosyltransferase family A protein [Thermoanaerobaculia bacterium]